MIPAGILLLMGVLLFSSTLSWLQYIWPAALILAGGFLIIRNFIGKK
jgi:drug/metabolite transporter (DMT)-like permease